MPVRWPGGRVDSGRQSPPRALGCEALPSVEGISAPHLQRVAVMVLPCEWRHDYGLAYDRPGTAVADADELYGRVGRLGLVLQPHRNHDNTHIISGWVAKTATYKRDLDALACDCATPEYGPDKRIPEGGPQPSRGFDALAKVETFYLHGAMDVGSDGSAAVPPGVNSASGYQLTSNSFPVYAPAQGVVVSIGGGNTGGNVVVVEHRGLDGFAYHSFFGHLRNGLTADLHMLARYSETGGQLKLRRARRWARRALGLPLDGDVTLAEVAGRLDAIRDQIRQFFDFATNEPLAVDDDGEEEGQARPSTEQNDAMTLYKHLVEVWGRDEEALRVGVGEPVSPGQLIGYAGSTGTFDLDAGAFAIDRVKSRTHLHYFFTVDTQTTRPPCRPTGCDDADHPVAIGFEHFGCPGGRVPSAPRVSIDPFGIYQYADELTAEGRRTARSEKMYFFVGPVVGPVEMVGPNPWAGAPVSRRFPTIQPRTDTVWLRQHDPVYSADRIRGYTRSLCDGSLVRSSPRRGVVEDLANDPRLVRLDGNLNPARRASPLAAPLPFRPLGSVRFNDPGPSEPLIAVVRAFDEQQGLPVVRVLRSGGPAGSHSPTCHPFECGDAGVQLPADEWPCFSEPDVATLPHAPTAAKARCWWSTSHAGRAPAQIRSSSSAEFWSLRQLRPPAVWSGPNTWWRLLATPDASWPMSARSFLW